MSGADLLHLALVFAAVLVVIFGGALAILFYVGRTFGEALAICPDCGEILGGLPPAEPSPVEVPHFVSWRRCSACRELESQSRRRRDCSRSAALSQT